MQTNNVTYNRPITFEARLVRNLNVANDQNVQRIMRVAEDFFTQTEKKIPNKELRMYKEPSDLFVTMSLFNKSDRRMVDGQGGIRVEALVEDNPTDSKLIGRLKKLLKFLEQEEKFMRLSDTDLATEKGELIIKQMQKVAGKDHILLDQIDTMQCII